MPEGYTRDPGMPLVFGSHRPTPSAFECGQTHVGELTIGVRLAFLCQRAREQARGGGKSESAASVASD